MPTVATPTDIWTLNASGAWSVKGAWSLKYAPQSADNVDIEAASPFTVTMDGGNLAFQGLTLIGATLDLEGGYLATHGVANLQNASLVGVKPLLLLGGATVSGVTLGGGVTLYNYGQVTQTGGAVAIGDSKTSTARIYNAIGATWTITDASGMSAAGQPGLSFLNVGMFQKTSGAGTTAVIKATFVSTGTISSASGGDIEFDGLSNLSGTYVGPGMVDYGPDGAAFVHNVQVTDSSCQTNWGTVYLTGDMTMYDGSTIMNAAGARWLFDGDVSLLLAAGQAAGPDINGMGMIAKIAGTGVSQVGIDVATEGSVWVNAGTLDFDGASSTFSSVIAGSGTFEIGGGNAFLYPGAALSVAHWTLAGGNTMFAQNLMYKGVFNGQSGATITMQNYQFLTFSGPPSINHQVELSGLTLAGAGYVQLDADTDISGATIGGTVQVDDMFNVTQTGNLTLGDSSLADAAYLKLVGGGDWSLVDNASISVGADARSTLNIGTGFGGDNGETLTKAGTGVSVVAPNVINECSNIPSGSGMQPRGVVVTGGTLDFTGKVLGAGTDTLISLSNNLLTQPILQFDGAVGAGQTIVFFGLDAELKLNDMPEFAGAIKGFGSGDSLLLGNGYYVLMGSAETATAATLSLVDAAHNNAAYSLTLTGDYIGHTFNTTRLNAGVLQIN